MAGLALADEADGGHGDVVVAVLLWSGRGLLLLLLLLGAAANGLALLAFWRGPGLRTLSNRFVMNLLVVNLAACASLLPLLLLDSTVAPSGALCSVSEGAAAGFCTASILGVLLIAGKSRRSLAHFFGNCYKIFRILTKQLLLIGKRLDLTCFVRIQRN